MFKKTGIRLENQQGQGMLEYILVVVFVVVLSIGVWKVFGENIKAMVVGSTNTIADTVNESGAFGGNLMKHSGTGN